MKQLKFLMAALLMVMGVTLSSCLNSEEGEYDDIYCTALVNSNYLGYTYFEASNGDKLYPTPASVAQIEAQGYKISDYKMALIQGRSLEKNETTNTNTEPGKIDFTLTGFLPYEYGTAIVAETMENMAQLAPETSPIITMKISNGYQTIVPSQFNNNVVILPIAWALQDSKDAYDKHQLALACSLDEVKSGDKEIVFYIRHDNGGDEKTETYAAPLYGYDISEALEKFQEIAGNVPTKVIIKAHENSQHSTEIPENYTEYSIDYKVINK